jgi:hypothetical protein
MSEKDQVFPRHSRHGPFSSETRHIVTAPRRKGSVTTAGRVVEVVQLARGPSKSMGDLPHSASWEAPAEAWPDVFHAKAPPAAPQETAHSTAPEPTPPIAHVMPMWEPPAQQPASEQGKPPVSPNVTSAAELQEPHGTKSGVSETVRRFADPFARDDDRANCIRCGYLVEQKREARGLKTCLQCG